MSEEKEMKETQVEAPPRAAKRSRWKFALLGLVILLCGMVIGAGITFHAGRVMMSRALSPDRGMAEYVMKRLDRNLGLTDEQKSQVSRIVAQRVSAFRGILWETCPRVKEQVDLLHDEIAPLLTEEQKLKWEKQHAKIQGVLTRIQKRLRPDGP